MSYFDKTPVGSVVSRLTNDTQAVADMFGTIFSSFSKYNTYVCSNTFCDDCFKLAINNLHDTIYPCNGWFGISISEAF